MARIPVLRSCAVAMLGLALVGCSSGGGAGASVTDTSGTPASSAPSSAGGAATEVNVKLQEWAVVPDTTTLSAGNVHFAITNTGPEDQHEFVVVRTDTPAGSLPTAETGAVDEDAAGLEVVDEVEELAVGSDGELTVDLTPGHYVVLCNIYNEAEAESHYKLGMRTDITVE
jgi:uncharacterized cupredoxin-like copper-binding protein